MKQLAVSSLTLGLLLSATSVVTSAEVRYHLTPIVVDDPPTGLLPLGLNNKGQVVGPDAGLSTRSFAWRNGEYVDLGAFFDPSTPVIDAEGINDRSDVVGAYLIPAENAFRGFLLRGNEVIGVEAVAGEAHVFLRDINNRNQIVGTTHDTSFFGRPFVWDRGEAMLLAPLAGGSAADANHINDRGIVVGGSDSAEGVRAVIWREGEAIDLGVVPGALSSFGTNLNNRGQVVGAVQFTVDEFGVVPDVRAFVWERGVMSELPSLTGARISGPSDINNKGDIVGSTVFIDAATQIPRSVATMWANGVGVDLQNLIRSDNPLQPFVTLEVALEINDRGQIVARGRDSRTNDFNAYLLSPSR